MSKILVNKTRHYSRMNLQLKKFNPASISDDRVCVFIGKRNTGKSTLVKDIMYHKKHLPAGIVLSGTERVITFIRNSYQTFSCMVIMTGKRSNESWPDRGSWSVRVKQTVELSCYWMIVCTTISF